MMCSYLSFYFNIFFELCTEKEQSYEQDAEYLLLLLLLLLLARSILRGCRKNLMSIGYNIFFILVCYAIYEHFMNSIMHIS